MRPPARPRSLSVFPPARPETDNCIQKMEWSYSAKVKKKGGIGAAERGGLSSIVIRSPWCMWCAGAVVPGDRRWPVAADSCTTVYMYVNMKIQNASFALLPQTKSFSRLVESHGTVATFMHNIAHSWW